MTISAKWLLAAAMLAASLTATACTPDESVGTGTGAPQSAVQTAVPDTVRAGYGIAPTFYGRYVDAGGIPLLGSDRVSDAALLKARANMETLTRTWPYAPFDALRERKMRVVILARGEVPSMIPETQDFFNTPERDARYWGGFGATLERPITAGTEENLIDNRNEENVFVHEFAHTIDLHALRHIDPNFYTELRAAYANAMTTGLWTNSYAASNVEEYWAEGVQSYFDVNREGPVGGDGVHNNVNTRAELRTYDVPLFKLIDRVYRGAKLKN